MTVHSSKLRSKFSTLEFLAATHVGNAMNFRFGLVGFVSLLSASALAAQTSETQPEEGWPRSLSTSAGTFSIYQPEVDKWEGDQYQAHAAVSVKGSDDRDVFGVIWIQARTHVDKEDRIVSLRDVRISKVEFPSVADKGQAYQQALRTAAGTKPPPALSPIPLDQLEASLAIAEAEKKGEAQPLKNDPPRLIFSTVPAVLVSIDGEPVWKPIKGTKLQRVINTRPLLVRDGATYYLHLYDGWLQTADLAGSWTVAAHPPAALSEAQQSLQKQVDLLDGSGADAASPKPTLANAPVPTVYISTAPAELVVTNGPPDYVPVPGTQLLYVKNTTGNVFKNLSDQAWYLLVSGRWYRASDLNGTWSYMDPTRLPGDFARIPDDSPKENVKASVPGTPQAQEAVIANSIPQTAVVKRAGTTPTPPPSIDGPPKLQPIEGTPLHSVVNASAPIIQAEDGRYYLVQNGIWFVGESPDGPWAVAAFVPASIYSIPVSSPLHYTTYVRVYEATPTVVYTGYTPGYFGTVIAPAGVVVYGTGYWYRPWIGGYWYPPPCTFGFGWSLAFTPWSGWAFGWGFGAVSFRWGGWYPRPWWGPYYWHGWSGPYRPVVWNSTTVNVYQRYNVTNVTTHIADVRRPVPAGISSTVGTAYNSRTGAPAAGQPTSITNAFSRGAPPAGVSSTRAPTATTQSAATAAAASKSQPSPIHPAPKSNGSRVYAGNNGQVYRQTPGGSWEQHSPNGTWHAVNDAQRAQVLSRQSAARSQGNERVQGFKQAQSHFNPPPRGTASQGAGGHRGGPHP